MVVLNTEERIITTQLALMIAYKHGSLLKSYSYNVSFLSDTNLFYNWYTSWGNYIDKIKSYIEIPFLGDWGVMTIDLKNYLLILIFCHFIVAFQMVSLYKINV